MRSQVLAIVFVALVACAQCQNPIVNCIKDTTKLAQDFQDFVKANNWSNMQGLLVLFSEMNTVVKVCGPLFHHKTNVPANLVFEASQGLGFSFNLACAKAMKDGISTIMKARGSFSGGLNPLLILQTLVNLGKDVNQIRSACKI